MVIVDEAGRLAGVVTMEDILELLTRELPRQVLPDGGHIEHSPAQQLAVLRREGLVATRRDGKQIFYRISSPPALAVIETLYRLFCEGQQ